MNIKELGTKIKERDLGYQELMGTKIGTLSNLQVRDNMKEVGIRRKD